MKENHECEPRLIYQKCPGCKADIECDAEECTFCEHKFQQDQVAEWDTESEALEPLESKSNSFFAMMALNVIVSLISVAGTSIERERLPGSQGYRHRPHLTEKDRELFVKFLLKHDKSVPAEIKAMIDLEDETEREKLISVSDSNNARVRIPYTTNLFTQQEFDPLEKFRVPRPHQ